MKHRIHYLLALVLFCLSTLSLVANDFEAKNSDGVTIYYNKLSDTECEVTYNGTSYYNCDYYGSITIPATVTCDGNTLSVTSIGDYAFYSCSALTSIKLSDGITSIGEWAFAECYAFSSITLSAGLTSIGDRAFSYCSSLNSLTFPEGLTSIGDYAFSYCESFTSINLPASISSIGYAAFECCHSLPSITVDPANTSYSSLDGVLFNKDQSILVYYPCGKQLSEYSLPNTVTSIGDQAFGNCASLNSLTLPEGVTSIGNQAFYDCIYLTSINVDPANLYYSSLDGVLFNKDQSTLICYPCGQLLNEYTIPNTVTSIGNAAFEASSSLYTIILPEGVTSIGDYAFSFCDSLSTINIPEGVTFIGDYAFYFCVSLTSINLPEGVTSIANGTFQYCESLTSINLPEGVTSIGEYAFNYCTSLTSVSLPEGVTSIGDEAFGFCESLTSITLPEGVTYIGDWSFCNCTSLSSVSNLAITPQPIEDIVFFDVPLSSITLYVPAGSIEAYQNAPVWQDFGQILDVEAKSEENGIASLYLESKSSPRYDLMGRRINNHPVRNIIIEQGKKSLVKK